VKIIPGGGGDRRQKGKSFTPPFISRGRGAGGGGGGVKPHFFVVFSFYFFTGGGICFFYSFSGVSGPPGETRGAPATTGDLRVVGKKDKTGWGFFFCLLNFFFRRHFRAPKGKNREKRGPFNRYPKWANPFETQKERGGG